MADDMFISSCLFVGCRSLLCATGASIWQDCARMWAASRCCARRASMCSQLSTRCICGKFCQDRLGLCGMNLAGFNFVARRCSARQGAGVIPTSFCTLPDAAVRIRGAGLWQAHARMCGASRCCARQGKTCTQVISCCIFGRCCQDDQGYASFGRTLPGFCTLARRGRWVTSRSVGYAT